MLSWLSIHQYHLDQTWYSVIQLFWPNKAENISEATQSCLFFFPTEREVLKWVLHVSENSGCHTVVVQVLLSFACSSCRNLFLRHFAWISSDAGNRTCPRVRWSNVYFTVKLIVLVVTVMCQWECRVGGNGGSHPGTSSAVGYDAAASSDLSVLSEDCTNAWSCRSSPFSCTALSLISHKYGLLYVWLFYRTQSTFSRN